MFSFILEIIIFVSLSVVVYLLARTLPRIDDSAVTKDPSMFKTHWLMAYLERFDEWLKVFLEKFLRRLKVWILKFDNVVSERLNQFKKEIPKDLKLQVEEKREEKILEEMKEEIEEEIEEELEEGEEKKK